MKVRISISKRGRTLTTRFLGKEIREIIEKQISAPTVDKVIIDFTDVNMVSHSFADECIGKIVQHLGSQLFNQKISFRGVSSKIVPLLRYVIVRRLTNEKNNG